MSVEQGGISVTLPAYNEADNIEALSEEIRQYFEGKKIPHEIIIVNDGSADETGKIADALAAKHKTISVIHHSPNQGYGRSLLDGFKSSRYEYLFFTDADRQFKIESLDEFIPHARDGSVDMIIGYRIDRQDPFMRKLLSGCFNLLIRIIFGLKVKDIDCAFKLFKKKSFVSLGIQSGDFLFNAEMLAKAQAKHFTIREIGVRHFPRAGGTSTVSTRHIFLTLKCLVALYREVEKFKKSGCRIQDT
jgi:glycosyltransferase involved in cell wall biosynthesis